MLDGEGQGRAGRAGLDWIDKEGASCRERGPGISG